MQVLLSPPIAFLIYVPLVLIILGLGRLLAGPEKVTAMKASIYGSGEAPPTAAAAPGYQPFFLIAFFFAILHLGVLMVASGDFSPIMGLYLGGLLLALLALILG